MVARGAGDVGCAHCTVIGADRSCQVCTRLVCERCGTDWTTCPEPTGREVRLGRTARLRDVDPSGRIGLVTRWVGGMRLFDLRRLRWVDVELPRHHKVEERQILERLTPTGELLFVHSTNLADLESRAYLEVWKRSLSTAAAERIETDEPVLGAGMTTDGHYYFVSSTQLVVAHAPDGTVRRFEPLPRRVVQACHLDLDRGVLASATWGEIFLHRIDGDKLHALARVAVTGNVSWLTLEEPWLAACINGVVRVWHVGAHFAVGREEHQHVVGETLRTASLSRDGRYLAMGVGRKVIVHDLDQDVIVTFDDHTDDICLVRFAGMDHLLLTADEDNRVVLRPRTPAGYVRSVIEIAVPDAAIKLELEDDLAKPI